MRDMDFIDDLEELSSAEEFLNYFDIEFEPSVVMINRLHIMQRFHDYLGKVDDEVMESYDEPALKALYHSLLEQAYHDFVESDALTEKVFKVFHLNEPQKTFVPLDQLLES